MDLIDFSSRHDDWTKNADLSFTSPLWREEQPEQVLIFSRHTKDGFIEAEITPLEGGKDPHGEDKKEACLLIRYQPLGYCAGLGGFDAKFFIARMNPNNWQVLASIGRMASISYGRPYRLKLEFVGSEIKLYENGAPLLSVIDESHSAGHFGLRTRKTKARFENVNLVLSKPLCFVVMPLSSELGFVYHTIRETVEALGLQCVRGDERSVSRPVIDDIRADIARADLVIVDFSGKNPNVYYEAGLADAWKKKWIVLAQAPDDLTFDVQHIRTIFYSNRMGADIKFRKDLEKAVGETLPFSRQPPE